MEENLLADKKQAKDLAFLVVDFDPQMLRIRPKEQDRVNAAHSPCCGEHSVAESTVHFRSCQVYAWDHRVLEVTDSLKPEETRGTNRDVCALWNLVVFGLQLFRHWSRCNSRHLPLTLQIISCWVKSYRKWEYLTFFWIILAWQVKIFLHFTASKMRSSTLFNLKNI